VDIEHFVLVLADRVGVVVLGDDTEEKLRFKDYGAYYRSVKRRFEEIAAAAGGGSTPRRDIRLSGGRLAGHPRDQWSWVPGSVKWPVRFISRRKRSWLTWRRVQCDSPTWIPAR